MCGLVGVFGRINEKEAKAFKTLLMLDTLRGEHSTGLCIVDADFKTKVIKALDTPDNLYRENPEMFDKGVFKVDKTILLMGHNRYATQGGITVETAHPFEFENCIGAHNGTVRPYSLKKMHEADKFDVDSQMIFSEISNEGVADSVWEQADGAMALSWWDKERDELNFARNKERPLHFATVNFGATVFWASESWMLDVALSRSGIVYHEVEKVEEDVNIGFTKTKGGLKRERYALPKKKPIVIQHTPNTQTGTIKATVKLEITEYVPIKNAEPWVGTFYGVMDNGKDVTVSTNGIQQEMLYNRLMANSKEGRTRYEFFPEYLDNRGDYVQVHAAGLRLVTVVAPQAQPQAKAGELVGFGQEVITLDTFRKVAKGGCTWCGQVVSEKEAKTVRWISSMDLLCSACVKEPFVEDYLAADGAK